MANIQPTSESAETLRKVLLSVIDDPLFQLGSPEMNHCQGRGEKYRRDVPQQELSGLCEYADTFFEASSRSSCKREVFYHQKRTSMELFSSKTSN